MNRLRGLPTPPAFNASVNPRCFAESFRFVSEERPPMYTPVTMRRHMETTLSNLADGLGFRAALAGDALGVRQKRRLRELSR